MAKKTFFWLGVNLLACYVPSVVVLAPLDPDSKWAYLFAPVFFFMILVWAESLAAGLPFLMVFFGVVAFLSVRVRSMEGRMATALILGIVSFLQAAVATGALAGLGGIGHS
jgi:hypothetical protein